MSDYLYKGGSGAVTYTDMRDFYVTPNMVKELFPSEAPFLTFMANYPKKLTPPDPQFKMFEYRAPWVRQYIYVSTGATVSKNNTGVTIAITPTNSTGVESTFTSAVVGYKCRVYASDGKATPKPLLPSLGTVVVTVFNSATSIDVKCSSRAAVTIPTPAFLEVMSQESAEGASSPESFETQPKVVFNQCGITRTSFEITNVKKRAKMRGWSNYYAERYKQTMQMHKIHNEKDLMFSANPMGTNSDGAGTDTFADGTLTDADGKVMRPTYGIISIIEDYGISDETNEDCNIFTVPTAAYGYDQFVDQSEKAFLYSSDKDEPLFCGYGYMGIWSKMAGGGAFAAKSKWTTAIVMGQLEKGKLGFNVRTLETPNGIYRMIPVPSLQRSPYNNAAFAPAKEDVFMVEYEPDHYYQNIKTDNNPLLQKNEFVTERGIGMTNLPMHKMWIAK